MKANYKNLFNSKLQKCYYHHVTLSYRNVINTELPVFHAVLKSIYVCIVALVLAGGVIVYISSVNVEVGHRKPSGPNGSKSFYYKYGWAFFFAGSAFVASMFAAVTNITLYLGKYSQLEDMTMIIPGLDKQAAMAGVKSPSHQHFDNGVQNPILNS